MMLIVDANILISALLSSEGKTRELLFLERLDIRAPPFLVEELESHRPELMEKSDLGEMDYRIALARTFSCVHFVPPSEYISSFALAASISPDPDDADYLALALHLNRPLWSNDKPIAGSPEPAVHRRPTLRPSIGLKKQALVKVLSTHELARLLDEAPLHD